MNNPSRQFTPVKSSGSVHWSVVAIACMVTLYLLSVYVDTLRYSMERGAAFREAQREMILMAAERGVRPGSQMAVMQQPTDDPAAQQVVASR